MKTKTNRAPFDRSRAEESFERYKETGKGAIMKLNPNKLGYSDAYADGWQRIFGKKTDIALDDTLDSSESSEEK